MKHRVSGPLSFLLMPSGAFLANASYNIKNFIWHAKHEEPCISPTLETSTFACTSCQRQQLQGTRSADKDYMTDKPRLSDHRTNPSNLTDVTISDMPLCSGRFFDIYVGEWSGRSVCFKVVRLPRVSSIKISSSEVDRWRQLSHPNILPFYGIYQNDKQVSLASPWMKKGDITEYLKHDQTSDRVHFFDDVAQGLKYLHENGIVHGDLKGKNVLVNEDGRAVLADFGTSSVIDADVLARVSSPSSVSQGTARWRAPETFNFEGDDELPDTTASDVYAFAMVAYEIFANQLPFPQLRVDISIMRAVVEGERPLRPPADSTSWSMWGLTDQIWSLMEACWLSQSEQRPAMQDVIGHLGPSDGRNA
ncbi:hypothetical protein H2248_000136 [Termitomyces sp. 'cryptogamus']|nr:hypothetical protein H2248_000136 [Termitomyces sp. 'cryptogamus']